MSGLEMMFSNLIGMKPAEIKEAATKAVFLIESAAKNIAEIQAGIARIEERLETLEPKGKENNGQRKRIAGNTGNDSEYVQL